MIEIFLCKDNKKTNDKPFNCHLFKYLSKYINFCHTRETNEKSM